MNDDADLLRSYVETHSEGSFAELVHRHLGLVYATALRCVNGDRALAEDVAQTVFTDLARKAAKLQARPALGGWLYVSTRLAAAAAVRAEHRRRIREADADAMQTNDVSPSANPAEQLRPLLDDALVDLKAKDRDTLVLRFFEQRSMAEIGAALRVTEEAARKRVDRALEKLRTALARRGVKSTASALAFALNAPAAPAVPAELAARVAHTAVANAAASASAVATGLAALWPAGAVALAGAFLLVPQYRANRTLQSELAQEQTNAAKISALRAANDALAAQHAHVTALRSAAAELPALRATLNTLPPLPPTVTSESVTLTPQGMINWHGEYITLDAFLQNVADLRARAPGGEAKLVIHARGTAYDIMMFGLEEARKAGIKHLVVDCDADPSQMPGTTARWF